MDWWENVYMVRRKKDGLYSLGGREPKFSDEGRVWRSIGPLRRHMRYACYTDSVQVERYTLGDKKQVRMPSGKNPARNWANTDWWETVYMVRRKKDGLYSLGGREPKFNNEGLIWRSAGSLQKHVRGANYVDPVQVEVYTLGEKDLVKMHTLLGESLEPIVHWNRKKGAACGLVNPEHTSRQHNEVSCANCRRMLARL